VSETLLATSTASSIASGLSSSSASLIEHAPSIAIAASTVSETLSAIEISLSASIVSGIASVILTETSLVCLAVAAALSYHLCVPSTESVHVPSQQDRLSCLCFAIFLVDDVGFAISTETSIWILIANVPSHAPPSSRQLL
jgi:hypothetical protein